MRDLVLELADDRKLERGSWARRLAFLLADPEVPERERIPNRGSWEQRALALAGASSDVADVPGSWRVKLRAAVLEGLIEGAEPDPGDPGDPGDPTPPEYPPSDIEDAQITAGDGSIHVTWVVPPENMQMNAGDQYVEGTWQ